MDCGRRTTFDPSLTLSATRSFDMVPKRGLDPWVGDKDLEKIIKYFLEGTPRLCKELGGA